LKIQHSHAGREQKKGTKWAGWVASGWAVGGKSNKCNDLNLERCVPGVDEGRRGSGRDKPATTHLTGANGTEADKNTRLLALFVFWQLKRPSDIINGALWGRIKVSAYTFYTRFSKYIQQ